jgi:GrpB-like predicted nucleotidyltransferase (UPF0157 family)
MTAGQPLHILPYDPAWPLEYEAERRRLLRALGAIARRIDHNGSTAVPGLDAKPIVDIQVSVDTLAPIAAFEVPLASLAYVHVPHADDAVCPFFHRPAAWPHTHHVHVVQYGGIEERRTLAFRDYLRENDAIAREYAALKRTLAAGFNATDAAAREEYAAAKGEFIERVIRTALAAGYPHL